MEIQQARAERYSRMLWVSLIALMTILYAIASLILKSARDGRHMAVALGYFYVGLLSQLVRQAFL